jgi:hypothetical protein
MVGEDNFELDMSLINFTPNEDTTIEVVDDEIVNNTKEIITDAEKQENVGKEVKEEILEEKEKVQDPDSPANSEEVFGPFAVFLKERGFFSNLDKEIKNEDDLAEALKEEIRKNEYADLNEAQIEYLEAIRNGIPEAVIQEHLRTRTIFNNITDDILENDEDVRKQLIIQDRMLSGWTQERAEKDYKRIYDVGASYEEAFISRDNIKEKEIQEYDIRVKQEEQYKVEQQKQEAKQIEELKQAVFNEDNLFGVFKVNDGLKQRVHETMTKIVAYTSEGLPLNKLMKQRADNPIKFEKDLYYLFELTNGLNDINKLINKSSTTAANKLRNAVVNSTYIKSTGNSASPIDEEAYDSPIVSLSTD